MTTMTQKAKTVGTLLVRALIAITVVIVKDQKKCRR